MWKPLVGLLSFSSSQNPNKEPAGPSETCSMHSLHFSLRFQNVSHNEKLVGQGRKVNEKRYRAAGGCGRDVGKKKGGPFMREKRTLVVLIHFRSNSRSIQSMNGRHGWMEASSASAPTSTQNDTHQNRTASMRFTCSNLRGYIRMLQQQSKQKPAVIAAVKTWICRLIRGAHFPHYSHNQTLLTLLAVLYIEAESYAFYRGSGRWWNKWIQPVTVHVRCLTGFHSNSYFDHRKHWALIAFGS